MTFWTLNTKRRFKLHQHYRTHQVHPSQRSWHFSVNDAVSSTSSKMTKWTASDVCHSRWQEDQEIVAYSEVLFRHTLKRTVWGYARHCHLASLISASRVLPPNTTNWYQIYHRMLHVRWIFRKWDVGVWTGSSWLRTGTGGGHLWMR